MAIQTFALMTPKRAVQTMSGQSTLIQVQNATYQLLLHVLSLRFLWLSVFVSGLHFLVELGIKAKDKSGR